jgi:hypothetical protein
MSRIFWKSLAEVFRDAKPCYGLPEMFTMIGRSLLVRTLQKVRYRTAGRELLSTACKEDRTQASDTDGGTGIGKTCVGVKLLLLLRE